MSGSGGRRDDETESKGAAREVVLEEIPLPYLTHTLGTAKSAGAAIPYLWDEGAESVCVAVRSAAMAHSLCPCLGARCGILSL